MPSPGMRIGRELKKVERWAQLLDHIPAVMVSVQEGVDDTTLKLIDKGFRSQTDPYGKRWKPKKRRDGRKTLHGPTGRLEAGWHRAMPGVVAPSVLYAIFHQQPDYRSRRLPRRMMVPDSRRGMPRKWSRAYREVTLKILKRYFKRGKFSNTAIKKLHPVFGGRRSTIVL